MKKVVVVVFLLALALGAGALAGCGGDLPGDAVAKVGDVTITEDVFNQRVDEFAAQYGYSEDTTEAETWNLFKLDVLEYLVTYELAAQKADDYEVTVTDEQVQSEIDSIVTSYYDGDQTKFTDDLATAGLTVDQLKANYRESMLMQAVYEKVVEGVADPTDAEIAAYYDANKDSYFVDETRTVRHILIAPGKTDNDGTTSTTATTESTTTTSLTDADWADALATAEKVRALLEDLGPDGDWTELAAQYSDDSGTADGGGDLGEVSKGQMVPEFEDAVFTLDKGEISEPVKSTYGYHIIEVTDISEAYQQTLTEVTDDIKSTLLKQKQTETWQKWIADSKVDLEVVYRADMQTTTTVPGDSTSTTVAGAADTTAGQTITTGAETTTTAKP